MYKKLGNKQILILFFISALFYIGFSIYGEKILYADGCNYFNALILNQKFVLFPPGRRTCDYFMQGPFILGSMLGIKSIKVLSILYGFGCTFWVVACYLGAILVCLKYDRKRYAEIIFVFYLFSIIFTGLYSQLESVTGVAFMTLQFTLVLLHQDKKKASNIAEIILLIILSLVSIHFNEFYIYWASLLATVVLLRILTKESQWRLNRIWLLLILQYIIIIYTTNADIKVRLQLGGSRSVGSIKTLLIQLLWGHKQYLFCIILISISLIISANILWDLWLPNTHKVRKNLATFVESTTCIFMIFLALKDVSKFGLQAYDVRWGNLGWGCCLIGGLTIAELFSMQQKENVNQMLLPLKGLVIALLVPMIFIYGKECSEFRDYNTTLAQYCIEHPNEGFVDETTTGLDTAKYRTDWMATQQCMYALILRGEKQINTIIYSPKASMNKENIVFISEVLKKYDIIISTEQFF